MSDNYVDLSHANRFKEPSSFFMVNALLKARLALKLESNTPHFDEDVNVYLADLMTSIANPLRVHKRAQRTRANDHEVAALASAAGPRERAAIYQANAESILIRFAIFDEGAETSRTRAFYQLSPRQWLGRARMYFGFAADILRSLARGRGGIPDILIKVAQDLDKYALIMRHACREQLNLRPRIREGGFFHLMRHVNAIGRQGEIAEKRDSFLDLYSTYLHKEDSDNGILEVKSQLNQMITELADLDPEFRCTPIP